MSEVIKLMSTDDFVDLTSVSENINPALIEPFVQNATIMYLVPVIGEAMYQDMMVDISTGGTRYLVFKEDYMFYSLSWFSLYNALPFIHMKIMAKGIMKQHSDQSDSIEMDELSLLIKRTESIAVSYTNRMRDYLDNNKTLYPLYRGNTETDIEVNNHGHSIFLRRKNIDSNYSYDPQNGNYI